MSVLLQNSGDFNWIEIIVVLVLVGGSALGSIGKWLIEKTSPKTDRKPDDGGRTAAAGTGAGQAEPSVPRRRAPSARPVARPMPGTEPQETPVPRPQARPLPPSPTARPYVSQEPPKPAVVPLPERKPRPVKPPPVRPVMKPAPAPPPKRRTPRVPSRPKKRKLGRLEPGLHPTLGEEEDRKFELREHRLGKLQAQAEVEPEPEEVVEGYDPIRSPTRRSLRHAILMREILGPPVALRPPDDRF
jgi:hypothetical protein